MNRLSHGAGRHQAIQLTAQRGFTLIEVMIVFFVLSVGLLGMAALQMKSMQYNQASYIRSQATVAAYDLLDRMRVNPTAAAANAYNINFGDALPTGTSIAETDLKAWGTFLAITLPDGQGNVFCAGGQCTIEIRWKDRLTTTVNPWIDPVVAITAQL